MNGNPKRTFIKGLAALLPTALTIFILVKLYEFISNTMGSWMTSLIAWIIALARDSNYRAVRDNLPKYVNVIGVVLAVMVAVIIVYFMGLALALFIGRRLWGATEGRLRRIPIINAIYPAARQVTDFFFSDSNLAFRKVVVFEYPRKGIFTIGFLTNKGLDAVQAAAGRELVTVFVPSSPTPFTGYCVQVPRDEIIEIPLPVDSALKYIISGGVILPSQEGQEPPAIASSAAAEYPGNEDRNKEE